jgi:hypothetical protein
MLNVTDTVSHVAMVVSIFCSLMLELEAGASVIWEYFLNATNLVCGVYFTCVFLYEFPTIKMFIRNLIGIMTFSDSMTFAEGANWCLL